MPRLMLLVMAWMASSPLMAQSMEPVDNVAWSVRTAALVPDYSGADPALMLGGGLIYRHRAWPALAVELELMTSVSDGSIGRFDFAAGTAAAYLAWRSQGRMYLKLRGGLLAEYVEISPADDWGAGLSGGAGVGLRLGDSLIELELTGVEKAAYAISLAWYF